MSRLGTSTPITSSKKHQLTSPDFPIDKKNRGPTDTTDTTIDMATDPDAGVKIGLTQMEELADVIRNGLKDGVKDTIKAELPDMAKDIITGVIDGLNKKISDLEKENKTRKKENKELKARVSKLETKADAGEQYSRRNSLRMSGVNETVGEITDELVLERAAAIGADITIDDIDRSHRVGKPKTGKPRDIIIKFATYHGRQKLYTKRTSLKDKGYAGVFLNEDLTKQRLNLLYKARMKMKLLCLEGAWSADGTILIKNNDDEVLRITSESDLSEYNTHREVPNDD